MNIINALKQYNAKNGELKRLKARLEVIDLRLENWDNLKASSVTDMPIHHDTENGDKIGAMVCNREEMKEDRHRIELEIAELNEFLVDVQTTLDCMNFTDRWILKKKYIEGYRDYRGHDQMYKLYVKEVAVCEKSTFNGMVYETKKKHDK